MKRSITIRLDDEIIEWFKIQGKGYQGRINAALREYIGLPSKESKTVDDQRQRLVAQAINKRYS